MSPRLLIVLVGCAGDPDDPKTGTSPPDDADTDADADSDADTDADADSDADTDTDVEPAGQWLTTVGDEILLPDGSPFRRRGANIHDTRSCFACAWEQPSADEVIRRIDELTDVWGANFLRLTLESYGSNADGQVQWQGVLDDPQYLADVVAIVRHAEAKPGVYVLLSLWVDPSFGELGWPTEATADVWRVLADTFRDDEKVLFGLVNEPQYNFDGALDPDVWDAMNSTVQAIRDVEDQAGTPHHVVTVQGTGAWARYLAYYVDHPITAGGGDNIVYEVHVYDAVADFQTLVVGPAAAIPVVIGEIGPSAYSSYDDVAQELQLAEDNDVPWLAWTFHPRCPPNLIVDDTGPDGCGVGMAIQATSWGQQIKDRLAVPW